MTGAKVTPPIGALYRELNVLSFVLNKAPFPPPPIVGAAGETAAFVLIVSPRGVARHHASN